MAFAPPDRQGQGQDQVIVFTVAPRAVLIMAGGGKPKTDR